MSQNTSQTKKCAFCGQNFAITDKEINYYEKISPTFNGQKYLIPSPKLCPRDRELRRLTYRNERIMYKRKSSLSGKDIISVYSENSPFKIFTTEEWWADNWDATFFNKTLDFNKSFFEQFYALMLDVPRPPLINNKAENSEYCNFADGNKNCYLLTSGNRNQDSYYDFLVVDCKNTVDSLWCTKCELTYESLDCQNCYNLRYSQNCENCVDCSFLYNCKGCNNCFLCINLRNQQRNILNKQYPKEEYEKIMKEVKGSRSKYQDMLSRFADMKKKFPIRKANNFIQCENVSGDNIFHSQNMNHCFDLYDSRDCAYSHDGLNAVDVYDCCFFDGVELCYESTSLIGYGYRFTNFCRDSYNLFYCDNCHACKNCFGCVGLRNKQYCIFNRQYSEKEYEELAAKIIDHMIKTGEWGEFFPPEFSVFSYNETLAYDYFPLTKEQIFKAGWKWNDQASPKPIPQKIQIPDNIKDIDESICNEVLGCEVTGENYKIIPQELKFYKRMDIPIPRKSPNTRTKERFLLRNPRKLWARKCAKCGAEIHTSYAPDKPETIYCESCYLKEVY
jgi:hypothetical protein